MTKPVEAASTQVTAGPYYNINEYSGRLYKWSVERLSPDNLVCLPIGCLGVLVSLVARVVEGALMLVVNFCLAVKGVIWGHTPAITAPAANGNAGPAKPPETEETSEGKKAKKKTDAEEATPPKKTDKKAAAKKVETNDVEEESGSEESGEVTDTEEEEEVSSSEESTDEVSSSEEEEEIPEVSGPDFDALVATSKPSDGGDKKTATSGDSGSPAFTVDWKAAGIDDAPKWKPIQLKQPEPSKSLTRQSSFLTKENAKRFGGGAAAAIAATVAGCSLPVIAPIAMVGALATNPAFARSAWNSFRGLGPDGCKANRKKAREESDGDVTPPPGSAPKGLASTETKKK